MHKSADETEYFLYSLVTCKLFKLVDNTSTQFNHQYYLIFLLIICQKCEVDLRLKFLWTWIFITCLNPYRLSELIFQILEYLK